jgi:Undecaprenyl-phosphate glucose phosphotransferase
MLKKHNQFFASLLFISDIAVIIIAWFLAYFLRFYLEIGAVTEGIFDLWEYLKLLMVVIVVWAIVFKYVGLYMPKRGVSFGYEFIDIVKASTISFLVLIAFTFFYRDYSYSRMMMVYFWLISIVGLISSRGMFRKTLRILRERGYNLRHVLIVGTGDIAERLYSKILVNAWTGFKVVGFLDERKKSGKTKDKKPILGDMKDIQRVVKQSNIDQVFIALPFNSHRRISEVLASLKDEMVDVRIVPDFFQYMTLNAGIEDLEGLPLINLSQSPMYGWNRVIKRVADIFFSIIILTLFLFPMIIIVVIIKLVSPGPLFYKQKRMGLGGEVFSMLKFRTMPIDAESKTGPVWAKENDPRRTRFGSFLRKTSLDELPQFINVLKGDMSIVGPRPERPVFIQDFRKKIPKYMLRHKMKAGITGWAQVNGWRGNTSLEKRIECDLFYIENWSLLFDLKIMWLTVWKGLINKNAY